MIAPLFAGSANGEAGWINEAGDVVGAAGLPIACPGGLREVQHAFLWSKGEMSDLGTVAGLPNTGAAFINSSGQIVGAAFACDFSAFDAILWENGSMVDLNRLITGNSGLQLYWASFIDDQGVIAAFGTPNNVDTHAVLLVPCDENHPGIQGCDYSLVDASSLAAVGPTPQIARAQNSVPQRLRSRLSVTRPVVRLGSAVRVPGRGGDLLNR